MALALLAIALAATGGEGLAFVGRTGHGRYGFCIDGIGVAAMSEELHWSAPLAISDRAARAEEN